MDNIKCISEVIGAVVREEILSYIGKNWRTINYPVTIENLQKKFEEMLGVRLKNHCNEKDIVISVKDGEGFMLLRSSLGSQLADISTIVKETPDATAQVFSS